MSPTGDAGSSTIGHTHRGSPGNSQHSAGQRDCEPDALDTRQVRRLTDNVQPGALRETLFEYVAGAEEKRGDVHEWRVSTWEHAFDGDPEMQTPTASKFVAVVDPDIGQAMMKLENQMVAADMIPSASSLASGIDREPAQRCVDGARDTNIVDSARIRRLVGDTFGIPFLATCLTLAYHSHGWWQIVLLSRIADGELQRLSPPLRACHKSLNAALADVERKAELRITPPPALPQIVIHDASPVSDAPPAYSELPPGSVLRLPALHGQDRPAALASVLVADARADAEDQTLARVKAERRPTVLPILYLAFWLYMLYRIADRKE